MVRPILASLALVAAVLAHAPVADAQTPSLADRETARKLMDEGDKKRDAGDIESALKDYQAADALMHVPTTGIEVARSQAALGRLLEARETLARVLRLPRKPNEPKVFGVARQAADELDRKLEARIPSIEIVLANRPTDRPLDVSVDGELLPPAALDAPRRVNPGAHAIVVRSLGAERRADVTVAERETTSVTIDLASLPPVSVPDAPDAPPETRRADGTPKLLVYSGFGVAVAGLAVGSVTGLMSLSKVGDLESRCHGNVCPSEVEGDLGAASTLGTISTVAFVAAGVGLTVGVTGLLWPRRAGTTSARAGVHLVLAPSYAGATGTF